MDYRRGRSNKWIVRFGRGTQLGERIRELHAAGLSERQIAWRIGVSRVEVRFVINLALSRESRAKFVKAGRAKRATRRYRARLSGLSVPKYERFKSVEAQEAIKEWESEKSGAIECLD